MLLRNEARCKERMVIFPRPEIPVKSSLKPSSQHLNEYGLARAGARMPNHCIVSLGRDGGRLAALAGWLAGGQGSGLAHLIHRHHRPLGVWTQHKMMRQSINTPARPPIFLSLLSISYYTNTSGYITKSGIGRKVLSTSDKNL